MGARGCWSYGKKRRDGGGERSRGAWKSGKRDTFQRSKKTPNSPVNKVGEESGVMEVLKTGWRG